MNRMIKVPWNRLEYSSCQDSSYDPGEYGNIGIGEFDYFVYSYATGSYEGDGVGIFKKDGKFYQHNLGHCSCYGPFDHIDMKKPYDSLHDLLQDCSDGLKEELTTVLSKVRELEANQQGETK